MKAAITTGITRYTNGHPYPEEDVLAVEEPMELRLRIGGAEKSLSITMRTPGNDAELATGFLFTEGIIDAASDIAEVHPHPYDDNIITVALSDSISPDLQRLQRNFYTTSSCGVCGKSSIDAVRTTSKFTGIPSTLVVPAALLYSLPDKLREAQSIFENTGGLHASGIFDAEGSLLWLREDVGRHNALDKAIGTALTAGQLPLNNHILLLSGRASFELIQKAAMAGIKMVAAVGAPSSLAVSLAASCGITLAGFLRGNRCNIYSHPERITVHEDQD